MLEDQLARVFQERDVAIILFFKAAATTRPPSWSSNMISQQRQHNIKELLTAHGKIT